MAERVFFGGEKKIQLANGAGSDNNSRALRHNRGWGRGGPGEMHEKDDVRVDRVAVWSSGGKPDFGARQSVSGNVEVEYRKIEGRRHDAAEEPDEDRDGRRKEHEVFLRGSGS